MKLASLVLFTKTERTYFDIKMIQTDSFQLSEDHHNLFYIGNYSWQCLTCTYTPFVLLNILILQQMHYYYYYYYQIAVGVCDKCGVDISRECINSNWIEAVRCF